MKRYLMHLAWLILLMILLGGMWASPIQASEGLTEGEVQTAVETWVRYMTADARQDAQVERMEPHRIDGKVVGYIVHLQDGGFALAGASELLLPVYLYNPVERYDPTNPGYQHVLWEMGARLRFLEETTERESSERSAYETDLAKRASQWQALKAGKIPDIPQSLTQEMAPSQMELNLTTRWHQYSPYNDQCPNLTAGQDERVVVGCVATAMSQIMNYWQWPLNGVGNDSVTYNWQFRTNWDEEPLSTDPNIPAHWTNDGRLDWTANTGGKLRMNGYWDFTVLQAAQNITDTIAYQTALQTLYNRLTPQSTLVDADFGATTYNWSVFQDVHTDPVDDGDPDLALLTRHVAVAANMNFGLYGSGSDLWQLPGNPGPMEQYFRYDGDIAYGSGTAFNASNMISEMQWLRPVAMGGSGPSGGHSWIVYGYNQGTSPWQFKMNMGWGGLSAWYTLDTVPQGLNDNHNYLFNIAPQNIVGFVGNTVAGDGSPGNPYQNIEEALNEAPDGATLIFKAGSDNTFSSGTLTLDRSMTLKGTNVTIRRQ